MIPSDTTDKIRCMIIDGYRDSEIERSTGICRKTIAKIRKPYGPYRPGRLFNLFAEDRKTMSAARVAEKHGYSRQTVYNVLKGGNGVIQTRGTWDQGSDQGKDQC